MKQGHAIVTINESAAHPIHKATIIPRGRALGMVMQLPERDEALSQTREQLTCPIGNIAMGGRVAEEIIFGDDKVTGQEHQVTLNKQPKEQGQW